MTEPEIIIGKRKIGPGHPVFIVAEMSANHGGKIEHAKKVIEAAADCGADAVKLQTYTADTLTIDCDAEPFRIGEGSLWEGRTLYDLYSEAHTPWEWHEDLKATADRAGITIFSSPFDSTAIDLLEKLDIPAYKIASFELIDLPLIEQVARTGKPIILSTGMASRDEIAEAVAAIRNAGNSQLALLKCTSAYPAAPEDMDLRTIQDMAKVFDVPVGLSDHTMGTAVSVAAVALGASIVEKHFCLSRDEGGPDSSFSMEPNDLRELVAQVRRVEAALGKVNYELTDSERDNLAFRRSLFVVEDMAAGETFSEKKVRSIRPGQGLAPKHIGEVIGKKSTRAIDRGTPLAWDMVG